MYEIGDYHIYKNSITIFGYGPEGCFKCEITAAQFIQHIAEGRGLMYDPESALIVLNPNEKDQTATICDMDALIEHGTKYRTLINFTMDEELQNCCLMFENEIEFLILDDR